MNNETDHIVEFWPKEAALVSAHDEPQSTLCRTQLEAVELERKFHEIGWPARAVGLIKHTERILLT